MFVPRCLHLKMDDQLTALKSSMRTHVGHLQDEDFQKLSDFVHRQGLRTPEEFEHLHPDCFLAFSLKLNIKSALVKYAKAMYKPAGSPAGAEQDARSTASPVVKSEPPETRPVTGQRARGVALRSDAPSSANAQLIGRIDDALKNKIIDLSADELTQFEFIKQELQKANEPAWLFI